MAHNMELAHQLEQFDKKKRIIETISIVPDKRCFDIAKATHDGDAHRTYRDTGPPAPL